jgi:cobalt/nickel transport system ATP-binding protein
LLQFKELLDGWVAEGKTIIFSTHDVDLTYEWADEVVILCDGKVIMEGQTSEVLTDEEIYHRAGLVKPLLYDLFARQGFMPRNMREAREYLLKIANKNS